MTDLPLSRRELVGKLGSLLGGDKSGGRPARSRPTPLDQIVLIRDFEANAKLKLNWGLFSALAAGDRRALDRITMRPRLMIPTFDLDMGLPLFGEKLFAPILIGAMPDQARYHPDGELATARGAAGAHAVMVVSSQAKVPIERLAAESKAALWYQADAAAASAPGIQRAVAAGCKAVCLSLNESPSAGWGAVAELRHGLRVPVLVRGITTAAEAQAAVAHGFQGVIISRRHGWSQAPITALPEIVDAVGAKVPVLVEDEFQLGVDIMKALALGARAALTTKPPMWGLASSGADGVRLVMELLQSELGRAMAMCGNPTLQSIDRSRVRLHTV